eukprot:364111-Chlamydomonas_euryale.AAC.28
MNKFTARETCTAGEGRDVAHGIKNRKFTYGTCKAIAMVTCKAGREGGSRPCACAAELGRGREELGAVGRGGSCHSAGHTFQVNGREAFVCQQKIKKGEPKT